MDDRQVRLEDLPTTVSGFCYHDDDGEEYVVLNARLTRESNLKTWIHEREHLEKGELYDPNYREYD